jgi:phosphoglycolate phosphatase
MAEYFMRAVIFDLDGTLIDSAPDIRAALNRVLAADGLAPLSAEAVREMIGDGARVLLERGLAAYGRTYEPRYLAAFIADYAENAVVETLAYPGIIGALEALRTAGHKLGVCTNKPEKPTRIILEGLGVAPYFQAITGGDSTPYRKPDPRHLGVTLAELGGGEAVMIGDHANDMDAASGLGIPSIFVRWGYGLAQGGYAVDHASQLPGLIAGMG